VILFVFYFIICGMGHIRLSYIFIYEREIIMKMKFKL